MGSKFEDTWAVCIVDFVSRTIGGSYGEFVYK